MDDQRGGEHARGARRQGGRGARAPVRVVYRHVLSGTERPGGGRELACERCGDLLLLPAEGGGRTKARLLRTGGTGRQGRPVPPSASIQARGGAGHPTALRGTVLPGLPRPPGVHSPDPTVARPPLPSGPLLRCGGGLPARPPARRAWSVQPRRRARARRRGGGPHPARAYVSVLRSARPHGRGALVETQVTSSIVGMAGYGAQPTDHGHHTRPPRARLDALL